MEQQYFEPKDVAQYFGTHVNTIYRWIKNKQLKAVNINPEGKHPYYRISKDEFDRFVDAYRT